MSHDIALSHLHQGTFIAGVFTILAIPVTIYEVAMHLEYFSRPKLQIRVIRILWMVPIYALDSWAALRFTVCLHTAALGRGLRHLAYCSSLVTASHF